MEINEFSNDLERERKNYIRRKQKEYTEKGFTTEQAINKANQSWRTYIGSKVQKKIFDYIKLGLEDTDVKVTSDKDLQKVQLPEELDMVRRLIAIPYGKYMFFPDADIILYKKNQNKLKVLAIISVKNSFRERGFETTYWKLKLIENPITSHIKVFIATPDKDDEISFIVPRGKPKKMRIILEYELDGIYFLKDDFENTAKAKHFSCILDDIKKLAVDK